MVENKISFLLVFSYELLKIKTEEVTVLNKKVQPTKHKR